MLAALPACRLNPALQLVQSPVNDGAKTITVDTSKTGGAITVAQLKASLEPSGGTASAFDTITVTDWTGTAAADTATVTSAHDLGLPQ